MGFRGTIQVAEFSLKGILKHGVVEEREMQTQLMKAGSTLRVWLLILLLRQGIHGGKVPLLTTSSPHPKGPHF